MATFTLPSPYMNQPKLGRLVADRVRGGYRVSFWPRGARKPALSGVIGDAPAFGDRGPASAARAFVSFASEPSAWDDEAEREASEQYGESLFLSAENHHLLRGAQS